MHLHYKQLQNQYWLSTPLSPHIHGWVATWQPSSCSLCSLMEEAATPCSLTPSVVKDGHLSALLSRFCNQIADQSKLRRVGFTWAYFASQKQ